MSVEQAVPIGGSQRSEGPGASPAPARALPGAGKRIKEFFVGGNGANFMVEWKSDKFVNPPVVESIMIGTKSTQGVSFTSRGRVLVAPEP